MSKSQTGKTEPKPEWQRDLESVGIWRRFLLSRHWFGADWWFAVISGVLLLFVFIVAIFPGWFAPFDPRAQVGPGLLEPGQSPPFYVLVSRNGSFPSLDSLIGRDQSMGIVIGSQSAQIFRDAADGRVAELAAEGQTVTIRPRIERYETIDEAMQALENGDLAVVIGSSDEIQPFLTTMPDLVIGDSIGATIQVEFTLGTNNIGQDVFSRIIWGTRIALLVSFAAAVFAMLVGVPLGLMAGFWTGRMEKVLTLFMDSLYSFPGLILAIAIAAVLGPGIMNIIMAIATLYIPTYYRIVRGQTLTLKSSLFVEAARSLGARPVEILVRYILPNVIPSLVVIFSVNVADAILTEAGLAFIGLGLPPDTPDWGIDLAAGQNYMRQAWWLVTFPGIMVTSVTLVFSMLGESLSEILNPRLSDNG